MSKLNRKFLLWTFLIAILSWGICIVCSANGITMNDNFLLYVPFLLGGWSPTIASFIVSKKRFKKWLADIFDFKHSILMYIMVIVLGVLFILPKCLVSGYENRYPLYLIVFVIPVMLLGGGLEEAGWRHIMQPELEKKCNFIVSTLVVAVIWFVWHLPLFYIQATAQESLNIMAFAVRVLGFSFALAAVKRITSSTWLCVLFHCLVNAFNQIYIVGSSIDGDIVSAAILIVVSLILVAVNDKKKILK